jgi:multiple sugar transport system substrate-binding protein
MVQSETAGMRATRRRVVAGLAAAGGVLAACGQGGATGSTEGSGSKAAPPVTFQYWDWAAVWQDLVGQLATGHKARAPHATVQWEIAADYWTKLQVAIAGDTAPDSWRMNGPNLPQWANLGQLQDVTAYFAKDKDAAASLKAVAPVITEYTKRDGKQWTMPFGQALSGIIVYNEEILRAEGLTPPADLWAAGRWTWAVLQEYAVKLTRRDGSRHGYFVNKASEVGWLPFLYANGGTVFDKEGKRAAVNTAESREALEFQAELQSRHQVSPGKQDLAQENAVNRFLNGRLAMLPQGSWEIKDLNLKAKGFKWDLVPHPLAPRTKRTGGTNQMASIAMSKSSRHKDAVWEWQKYIGSKEGQDVIARAEFFPARLDSAEQIYYDAKLGPAHRPLLREVLRVVQPLPWLLNAGRNTGWDPIATPLIDQMFEGQLSVKDGVQQLHDQLNATFGG